MINSDLLQVLWLWVHDYYIIILIVFIKFLSHARVTPSRQTTLNSTLFLILKPEVTTTEMETQRPVQKNVSNNFFFNCL